MLLVFALLAAGCAQDSPAQLKQKARAALGRHDYVAAEIHLKNLLRRDGADGEARVLLGSVHAWKFDWPSAEKEYRKAIGSGSSTETAAPGLFEAVNYTRSPAALVEEIGRYPLASPAGQASAAYWTGQARLRQGNVDGARQAFETALRKDPSLVRARAGMISLQALGGDRPGALQAAQSLLSANPASFDVLALVAELRAASGNTQGAAESLRQIVAAWPANIIARTRLVALEVSLGDFATAQAQLAQVLKRAPNWSEALAQKADIELRLGRLDAANDAILLALRSSPDDLPLIALAASIALNRNEFERVDRYARQLLERAPRNPDGHRFLAAVRLKTGDAQGAMQALRPYLASDAADPTILAMAGEASLRLNDPASAVGFLTRAVKAAPLDAGKWMGLAMAHLVAGDSTAAIDDLERAARLDAGSLIADQLLIKVLVTRQQYPRALEVADRMAARQPRSPVSAYLRGLVQLASGDRDAATQSLQQSLVLDAAYFPAVAALASIDLDAQRPDGARARFDTFLASNPGNEMALMALANLTARDQGPDDQVLGYLKKALEANATSTNATLALSGYYVSIGRAREAIPLLQSALERNPANPTLLEAAAGAYLAANEREQSIRALDLLTGAKDVDTATLFRAARLRTIANDAAGALAGFKALERLAPSAIEPRIGVAAMLARTGKTDEALRIARDLKKSLPDNPAGWQLEADLQAAAQHWPDAVANYRTALSLQPGTVATVKLHRALIKAGQPREADALLARRLAAAGDDTDLLKYAGEVEVARQHYRQAAAHFEHAAQVNPRDVVALNNLAWTQLQLKSPDALPTAQRAFSLAPRSAEIADTLATALMDTKDTERALQLYRQAVDLAPRSADLRLRNATALASSGNRAAARGEIDLLVRDFPATPQAQAARDLAARIR